MQHLISIAIGPVQEFIASARRSRDLWFGSWLLSELSKAVARSIVEQPGCNLDSLIFPRITNAKDLEPNSDFNVVNKLLAVIGTGDPASFGKQIKDAVDDRLRTIRNQAWRRFNNDPQYFQRETAELQVDDLIEFFWAVVPLDDPKNYKAARDRVEALLAARKTTRNFAAVGWGQPGVPKSSLDGQRESVIHENAYEAVRQGRMTEEELRRKFQVRPGERLCGVGLLKRLGRRYDDDSFFSTSHVAALPLLERLKDEMQRAAVQEYLGKLWQYGMDEKKDLNEVPLPPSKNAHPIYGRRDGHLLFEERLREYFPPKEKPNEKKLAEAALRHLLRTAFDDQKPIPYYVLLLADGDRMGKVIDTINEIGRHRELSQRLSEFAGSVRAVVENRPDDDVPGYQGSLVYAGGDDVLAFVPLHRALDCARKLADEFRDKLKGFKDGDDHSPTLSVGIAIAHHLDPLSDALELARAAEKAAKSVPGKDALCFKVCKRGGSVTTVADKWGKLNRRLAYFTLLHRAEAVPDGAAYELRDLSVQIGNLPAAMKLEAIRILKRKRAARGQEKLEDKVFERLKKLIENAEIAKLADELIVARLLAEAATQSGATAEQARESLNQEAEHEDLDH
ncbi:MAG: type III-B CRISPR-associated protein Cas10/Cmr2 [Acidobacteria bacterium]|nr:type III-B CRISPR-associated protein Cas10/Cmr2 [Acidobacteriota bacterium]